MSEMPALYIGLMSGTSCDGVDGVLAEIGQTPDTFRVISTAHLNFDVDFQRTLHALQESHFVTGDPFHVSAGAANELMDYCAEVVYELLAPHSLVPNDIFAIGCHGQTIRHRPELGYTIQIHNASRLAEKTGITVIADWRSRDVAAGGQGAPLVPAFHAWLFGHPLEQRVILNLGGIANITYLPSKYQKTKVIGFDCGPANVLLDNWIRTHLGLAFDKNGSWASSGTVIPTLLARLKLETFFAQQPPKSTGRDLFNLEWIYKHGVENEAPVNVQATLLELTASTVTDAINAHCKGVNKVYVCGGGVKNKTLMNRLKALLPVPVQSTLAAGLAPEWVEAAAFAWLASQTLNGRTGNLPAVTGAEGHRILGAIYPK